MTILRAARAMLLALSIVASHSLFAQVTKCVVEGKVTYTSGECPKGAKRSELSSEGAAARPGLPRMQSGLWRLEITSKGVPRQDEICGDPLERIAGELAQAQGPTNELGCSIKRASKGPRHFRVDVDCPTDAVSADGSRRVQKGRAHFEISSRSELSYSASYQTTAMRSADTINATWIRPCE